MMMVMIIPSFLCLSALGLEYEEYIWSAIYLFLPRKDTQGNTQVQPWKQQVYEHGNKAILWDQEALFWNKEKWSKTMNVQYTLHSFVK